MIQSPALKCRPCPPPPATVESGSNVACALDAMVGQTGLPATPSKWMLGSYARAPHECNCSCKSIQQRLTLVTKPCNACDRLADTMPSGGLNAHTLVSAGKMAWDSRWAGMA